MWNNILKDLLGKLLRLLRKTKITFLSTVKQHRTWGVSTVIKNKIPSASWRIGIPKKVLMGKRQTFLGQKSEEKCSFLKESDVF
jgi:hypothetical protein